jgi:hypothetical protein
VDGHHPINDPKHWRNRAAAMRALSETMNYIDTQVVMLKLAEDYDKLADRAEKRANGQRPD